jgi:transposase
LKNKAQEKLGNLIKQLKADNYKYEAKEQKQIDWPRYDEAQVNEINDMLILMREVVEKAAQRLGEDGKLERAGPGRPKNSPSDEAKVILMQQYFCASNRVAAGYALLFKEKLHLSKIFSYKTIERAYQDPQVAEILQEVFRLTQEPVCDKEHTFGPDGTGLSTSMKQNYENDRQNGKVHKGYEKMIVMVGCTYKLFSAFQLAHSPVDNESPYFEPLLAQTAECYDQIDSVCADSAFLSRLNCSLADGVGAVPRIYPKEGVTMRQFGSVAWRKMLLDLLGNPQKWLREYHARSNAETAFSTFKRDCPVPLRKKISIRKKQEAFTRACNYNLKRLCYLHYLKGITATEAWTD